MDNNWRNTLIICGLMFIAIIFIIFSPAPSVNETEDNLNEENLPYEDTSDINDQFDYTNYPHFSHMPISYYMEENCVGTEPERIKWGFNILSEQTNNILIFIESNNNSADIKITCYPNQKIEAEDDETIITLGLGGYSHIGNVITEGTLEFFSVRENSYPSSCMYFPSLEIHEILHVLGFDHNFEDPNSIMAPEIEEDYCQDEIDKDILFTLRKIYSPCRECIQEEERLMEEKRKITEGVQENKEICTQLSSKNPIITCKNITFDYKKESFFVYVEGNLTSSDCLKSVKVKKRTNTETIYEICYFSPPELKN